MENIEYTFEIINKEMLSPEEVHFFYYDVMRNTEDTIQSIYEWNEDIEESLNKKGLTIKDMNKGTLPLNIETNVLFFSISPNESKPIAFFRHLRNAFAHHQIVRYGDYLKIKDVSGNDVTMIGLLKYQDVKELCFLFFDQKTKFEANNVL